MTLLERVAKKVEELDLVEDVTVDFYGGKVHLDVLDFDGFDEDWDEIDREYDVEGVEKLQEWLSAECVSVSHRLYTEYTFEDGIVSFGYESFDI